MAQIEIELQDVLDFIDNDASTGDFKRITNKVLGDDYITEFEDQIKELEEQNDDLQDHISELQKENDKLLDVEEFEVNTLYDEMKLKLLKKAIKVYSLEELENRLGKEFDLSIGFKK